MTSLRGSRRVVRASSCCTLRKIMNESRHTSLALLPNEQDAQDVFQRTSLVLWQKFDQFDSDRDFLPWACGVAHYEVRNFLGN